MKPNTTMTWAGPLPPQLIDVELPAAFEPILWAGPLPPRRYERACADARVSHVARPSRAARPHARI